MVCAYPIVVVSIVPQAEFGPNDLLEDASHFIETTTTGKIYQFQKSFDLLVFFQIRSFVQKFGLKVTIFSEINLDWKWI